MNGSTAPRITGRVIVGGLLILFGLIFTLDNFGLIDAGDVFDYWPVILIVVGIARVFQPRNRGERAFGFVMIGLGIFFQLQALGLTSLHFYHLWPIALVFVGGALIWRALDRSRALGEGWALRATPASGTHDSSPHQSDFAFMGGVHRIVESSDFRGGEATAVMGAVELDLRGAKITTSAAVLDVFALWGGIELTVPPDWRVDIEVMPILGGVENKARTAASAAGGPEQVLIVRGTALMGGVEIKN